MNPEQKIRRSGGGAVKALCFFALICTSMALAIFVVDIGHVIFAKMQLQYAANRAARAGAAGLAQSWQTAQDNAIAAAGKNSVDGSFVCLLPSNVDFGMFDRSSRSFTVLNGAARSHANAIRVMLAQKVPLTFGPLTGKPFCEVHASRIASLRTSSGSAAHAQTPTTLASPALSSASN